jgi:tetratricopeptide (TPR) repeat protein
MSTQNETSPPASTFDPELAWALHGHKIIVGLVALVVIALGIGGYLLCQNIRNSRANNSYLKATDIGAWQRVVKKYPGTVAAGNAWLRIGAAQARAGDFKASDTSLQTFIHDFPNHPFLPSAHMALAENAESENRPDNALKGYEEIATRFGTSSVAPLALFNQGRLTEAAGKLEAARAIYENVVQRYPESYFAVGLAREAATRLNNKLGTTPAAVSNGTTPAGASPSPTQTLQN